MFKMIKLLKPFTVSVIAILVLVFFQTLSQLYLPTLMADIVDKGIVNRDTAFIVRVGGIMLLVAAGGSLCMVLASYLSAKTGTGFSRILRQKIFTRVESFSLHEFDQTGTASLITRTTNDVTQIEMVLMLVLRMMVSAPIMCIGGIILAVSKDIELSLIILVALPVLSVVLLIIAKKGLPLFKALQKKLDILNLVLRENLTGIRVIRAFNRVDYEKERFDSANKDLTETSIKVNKIMAFMMPMMMLLFNYTTIAIVWFGSIRVENSNFQVGDLMAFIQYVMQIMFSLLMVSMMFVMLPRASVSAARINKVLDTVSDINDPDKEIKPDDSKRGFVEFRNVTFCYPGAEQPAANNISFCTGPGEVTAIIGGTGSGKSTLVHLIERFYDVESGSILVNGTDIREMTQETLRSKIGFVSQKAVLFTGTIAENIRYGNKNADDEEVKKAADIAQATEFISGMKEGFNSVISQGGTNLSGGQKQRISIARALVRKPDIYVFDDSFSALDFKTDARLRAALEKEISDAAVIIVTQRVSTVMNADQIIVLEDGKIAGIGKHRELLNNCGVYREIVSSQLSEEELA